MDTGSAHSRSFQLHRSKNCHWIDQSCTGRTPFDGFQRSIRHFIRPFKRIRISWEFCSSSQRFSVGNIIIQSHQSIGWKIIFLYFISKIFHRFIQSLPCNHPIFRHFKSLIPQPFHLLLIGIFKVHLFCPYQRKCIKPHMAVRSNLIV